MINQSYKFWLIGMVVAIQVAATFLSGANAQTKTPIEHTVEITNFKFVPDNLSVKIGDTITWINKDIAPHTATAMDKTLGTGKLKRGEKKNLVVTKDFVANYYCRFHPVMKAKLMIKVSD